jgi:DNA-directed RNA polymerase specialized sigma24 family protein
LVPCKIKNKKLVNPALLAMLCAKANHRCNMSIAREIASHLPYLRRFARALSGTQASGDAYVAATLEALIADPSAFPKDLPGRIAVYRVFVKLWSSANQSSRPPVGDIARTAVETNLDALTPLTRQAFLLRTVEGFSLEDVAVILDRKPSEAALLLEQAGREIAEQVATSVLIIEDEHDVTGIARTHKEAMVLVRTQRPGLVLADIQLADGSSGLEAVNEILQELDVPVIFITAYPERLLTGNKPEPAFLITKPFQPEAVKAAISQALFFDRRAGLKVA